MVTQHVEKVPNTESDHEFVNCEICLKSIPKSDSTSAEADDYVAYFCGLECYDQWVKPKSESEKK